MRDEQEENQPQQYVEIWSNLIMHKNNGEHGILLYFTSRCRHTDLASLIHQTVWDPVPSVKTGINNATINYEC